MTIVELVERKHLVLRGSGVERFEEKAIYSPASRNALPACRESPCLADTGAGCPVGKNG